MPILWMPVKARLNDIAGTCADACTALSRGSQQASEPVSQYCPQ